ncbi:MAG: hypothetical protein P4M00_13390 [Azospirillaceae bacterium]|nr:hypothetical protein [Azospirillaceae bacterium]
MSADITPAGEATTAVQGYVAKALDALNDYRISEHDVFVNPTERRTSLLAAQDAISAALMVMDRTTWPNRTDDS